jgi:tetratricopeptide (TPR) repeat protein
VVYWNSLRVPFLLDDSSAILNNRSIAAPLRWASVLAASHAGTATGRPLLNLSFALNRLAGGESIAGYHIVNMVIHGLAALVLFGLVRRTLALKEPSGKPLYGVHIVAAFCALIWAVHPLLTEAVTYISQRAESLAGLLYLFTLYAFARGAKRGVKFASATEPSWRGGAWLAASVLSCVCGMATKEVVVTAPVLVLLYDRAFLSESFLRALRRRKAYYCGLAASWILLGILLYVDRLSLRSVGYGLGVDAGSYFLTEAKAIVSYLWLVVWPASLVFDYGREYLVNGVAGVGPQLVFIAALLSLSVVLWRRNRGTAFLLLSFFIVLAPTSSVVPIASDPMAESRMYLASAPLVILIVLGFFRFIGRASVAILAGVAILLAVLTVERNRDYSSAVSMWEDTVTKAPSNSRAHENLGVALSKVPGSHDEALRQYKEALRLRPSFPEAHRDLAVELSRTPGGMAEAIENYREAIRLRPNFPEAETGLGVELGKVPGKSEESLGHLRTALELDPDYPEGHANLAGGLAKAGGHEQEAIGEYRVALRFDPGMAEAHNGLGAVLARMHGEQDNALEQFAQAIRIRPGYINAMSNRAKVLSGMPGGRDDAIEGFRQVLSIDPKNVDANFSLGKLLMALGVPGNSGIDFLSKACELAPRRLDIQIALANALLAVPARLGEAQAHFEAALAVAPNLPEAHNGLGVVFAKEGNRAGALEQFQAAVDLRPGFTEAMENLRALQDSGGK